MNFDFDYSAKGTLVLIELFTPLAEAWWSDNVGERGVFEQTHVLDARIAVPTIEAMLAYGLKCQKFSHQTLEG